VPSARSHVGLKRDREMEGGIGTHLTGLWRSDKEELIQIISVRKSHVWIHEINLKVWNNKWFN
jgi:hypothetical protein